jgi:hypothetical protein
MNMSLRVVGKRCDKLVFAYRVALDPLFMGYLREQARTAREHGRAEVSWRVMMPRFKDARAPERGKFRKLGAVPMGAWASDPLLGSEARRVLWGELRFSRTEHKYIITNEPFVIIAIDPYAPGGDVGKKSERQAHPARANIAQRLDESEARVGIGAREEPGFTVEISVYAQHLAKHGLEAVERECEAIAWMIGEVKEKRLRRIDLCVDVAGMTIREDDVSLLVKRSRAAWVKNFADGTWEDARGELHCPPEHAASDEHGKESGRATWVRASGPMRRVRPRKYVPPVASRDPRLTGLSVGRGGAMMMRIYDKREELSLSDDRTRERREVEEHIWRSHGWDGQAPVCRVEFQVRGEALRDLGMRDPDCMKQVERDDDGNAIGEVVEMVMGEDGKMRRARLGDWLDRLWATCVRWCRLVTPALSKNGRPLEVGRCELDPRWSILHGVRFDARWEMPKPLARFRKRGAGSAAQSLGVALSQAAREGQLIERWEDAPEWYARLCNPKTILRMRVRLLMRDVEARCVDELVARWGDAVQANVHLAKRANAARARFMREDDRVEPYGPRVVGRSSRIATGVKGIVAA